ATRSSTHAQDSHPLCPAPASVASTGLLRCRRTIPHRWPPSAVRRAANYTPTQARRIRPWACCCDGRRGRRWLRVHVPGSSSSENTVRRSLRGGVDHDRVVYVGTACRCPFHFQG